MKSFTILIRVKRSSGALERVLGAIRYRGYTVVSCEAFSSKDNKTYEMRLEVQHRTRGTHLNRHLNKLYEVEHCSVEYRKSLTSMSLIVLFLIFIGPLNHHKALVHQCDAFTRADLGKLL